eukprot:956370-Pelagomonas_calceolata.AAC.7
MVNKFGCRTAGCSFLCLPSALLKYDLSGKFKPAGIEEMIMLRGKRWSKNRGTSKQAEPKWLSLPDLCWRPRGKEDTREEALETLLHSITVGVLYIVYIIPQKLMFWRGAG